MGQPEQIKLATSLFPELSRRKKEVRSCGLNTRLSQEQESSNLSSDPIPSVALGKSLDLPLHTSSFVKQG